MCAIAKEKNIKTAIFCGDWHHNRNNVSNSTLHYSLRCFETLSNNFDNVFIIGGNHDYCFRDKRDIASIDFSRNISNITVVNDIMTIDNITLCPWLVGEEYKKLKTLKSEYLFAHLEIPGFYMNANIQMPDHGGLNGGHLSNFKHVYVGHFHKRQTQGNITYLGNCFPHNYNDANDDERGIMIFDQNQPHEFLSWPDAPRYRKQDLKEVLNNLDQLDQRYNLRLNVDLPLDFEDVIFIKETLTAQFDLREIELKIHNMEEEINYEEKAVEDKETLDETIIKFLSNIDSTNFSSKLLVDIYKSLN